MFATLRGLDRIDEISPTHITISFCPEDEREIEYFKEKILENDEI